MFARDIWDDSIAYSRLLVRTYRDRSPEIRPRFRSLLFRNIKTEYSSICCPSHNLSAEIVLVQCVGCFMNIFYSKRSTFVVIVFLCASWILNILSRPRSIWRKSSMWPNQLGVVWNCIKNIKIKVKMIGTPPHLHWPDSPELSKQNSRVSIFAKLSSRELNIDGTGLPFDVN